MTAPRFSDNSPRSRMLGKNKWVVLGACFAINFISSALFRNAALFYPSIMDTFLVTRERAALPLFVYGGCFHLGALLGGTVIQVLTVWAAAVAGGMLLSVTFIAASFANGTAFLTVVLGVLGGTGQGIIFNCSVVGLTDYFSSQRGLALGVVMTGAPAASFIFPAIFNYALEEHGLRGTLLFTGACMLNIPAFALLLRDRRRTSAEETCWQWDATPNTKKSKLSSSSNCHSAQKQVSVTGTCRCVNSVSKSYVRDNSGRFAILSSSQSFSGSDRRPTETSSILKGIPNNHVPFSTARCCSATGNLPLCTWPTRTNKINRISPAELHDLLLSSVPALFLGSKTKEILPIDLQQQQRPAAGFPGPRGSKWKALIESAAIVVTRSRFYVIAYSFWAYCFFLDTYLTVTVDYSADSGVAQDDALHVLTFFSVTDALCRLVIPLLTDCKLLSTPVLLACSYLLASILAGGLAFLTEKFGFWIVALALGLPCGYINVGLSESLSTVAGEENLPMALGFMSAAAAVGSFTTPSLIGLFRDICGSYDDLFFIMAGALMVSFVLYAGLLANDLVKSRKLTIST
ncbi:monocarboxylate transporter 9-like [Dermacentor albipictus]|uniref:monocarboxylate transporter 9-like n=1 Tax=Dermacentor albipictus TaxID=60249 RepID=UPI0038FD1378